MGKCHVCGIHNNDSAKFCRNCGVQLNVVDKTQTKKNNNIEPNKGDGFLVIIGWIGVILALVLFFVGEITKPIAIGIALGSAYLIKNNSD